MHLIHLNESKFRGDLFWHRLLLMDASFWQILLGGFLFVGWRDFSNFGQFQEHLFSKINAFIAEIQVTDQGKSIFFV